MIIKEKIVSSVNDKIYVWPIVFVQEIMSNLTL